MLPIFYAERPPPPHANPFEVAYLLADELPTSGTFASVPKQILVPVAEEGHRPLADHPIDHSGKVESGIKFPFGVGSILPLVLETISFLIIG